MCIQKLLGNTIVDKASDALILSLSPKNELPPAQQQDKIQLIYARNRVLNALNEATKKLPETDQKKLLQEKIKLIKNFYYEIGGEIENASMALSLLSPAKLIEGPIPSSIIASTKPDDKCTPSELAKKQEDQKLRDAIISAAKQKAADQKISDHLNCFLNLF